MNFDDFIWVSQNVVAQTSSNFPYAEGLFTDSVSVCHVLILIERFRQHKKITLLHVDNCSHVDAAIKKSIENVNNTTVIHAYNTIVLNTQNDPVDINQFKQTQQRCLNALYQAGIRQIKHIEIPDGAIAVSKNGEVFYINQGSMDRKTAMCHPPKMLIGIRLTSFFEAETISDDERDVIHNKHYSSGFFLDSYLRPMRRICFLAGVAGTFENLGYSQALTQEKQCATRHKRVDLPSPETVQLDDIASININEAPVPASVLYNNISECFRSMR